MADGGVARQRFHVWHASRGGSAHQRALGAAVLVAQRDLEMEYPFAVTLEAEVSRLDHSGVDRPDGHFVDLLALDLEEVGHAGENRLRVRRVPRRRGRGGRTGGNGWA